MQTTSPMLQDLNNLADRISKLASYTEQLKAERASMLARLKSLESERDTLRDMLEKQQNDYVAVAEVSVRHQAEVEAAKKQAEEVQEALFVELVQHQNETVQLRSQLQRSQEQTQALRSVAEDARNHVASILLRLPGNEPQE